jgi:hypothetical protein
MNKREKEKKETKAKNALEGIEGNIDDVSNKIDLLMAANTNESQENNNNNYESCVDSDDIAKKGALIMPNIDIEDIVEQIGGTTLTNTTNEEGGDSAATANTNRIEC